MFSIDSSKDSNQFWQFVGIWKNKNNYE